MTWQWKQADGLLVSDAGEYICAGYSGCAEGKNNPAMQTVANVGPIPCGLYDVGSPCDTEAHGPYVLPLTPHEGNEMFGRGGFLIHGDSKLRPGTASKGCIILARWARELIVKDGVDSIEVIP
jgi:hypothetical protein